MNLFRKIIWKTTCPVLSKNRRKPVEKGCVHLGEIFSEVVAGAALDGATVAGHEGFHRGGHVAARELLFLGLDPLHDRHRQQLVVDTLVTQTTFFTSINAFRLLFEIRKSNLVLWPNFTSRFIISKFFNTLIFEFLSALNTI